MNRRRPAPSMLARAWHEGRTRLVANPADTQALYMVARAERLLPDVSTRCCRCGQNHGTGERLSASCAAKAAA